MLSSKRKWLRASLACLQRELSSANACINFLFLDDNNPYAVFLREDLRVIIDSIKRLRHLSDDEAFQSEVGKGV